MFLTGTGIGIHVVSDLRGDHGEEIVVGLQTLGGREIPINGNPVALAEVLLDIAAKSGLTSEKYPAKTRRKKKS